MSGTTVSQTVFPFTNIVAAELAIMLLDVMLDLFI